MMQSCPVYAGAWACLSVCSWWRVSAARFNSGCSSLHYGNINVTVLCVALLEERIIFHLCEFLHVAHIITPNYCSGFAQQPEIIFNNYLCVFIEMRICQNEEITLSWLTWFLQRAALTTGVHTLFVVVSQRWQHFEIQLEVHVCLWFLLNYSLSAAEVITAISVSLSIRCAARGACNVCLHQLCQIYQFLI